MALSLAFPSNSGCLLSMQETFYPTGYKLEDRSARAFDSFGSPETRRHLTPGAGGTLS